MDTGHAPERLNRYFMSNLIGNPMDTAIAATSLVLGGVLERAGLGGRDAVCGGNAASLLGLDADPTPHPDPGSSPG